MNLNWPQKGTKKLGAFEAVEAPIGARASGRTLKEIFVIFCGHYF